MVKRRNRNRRSKIIKKYLKKENLKKRKSRPFPLNITQKTINKILLTDPRILSISHQIYLSYGVIVPPKCKTDILTPSYVFKRRLWNHEKGYYQVKIQELIRDEFVSLFMTRKKKSLLSDSEFNDTIKNELANIRSNLVKNHNVQECCLLRKLVRREILPKGIWLAIIKRWVDNEKNKKSRMRNIIE
ncbi:10074_t:CDS:2, partial [Ambispora leptoticha]